jgi:phosphatidylglycerophosphatase A
VNLPLAIATMGPIGYAPFSGTVASFFAFIFFALMRLVSSEFYYTGLAVSLFIGYYAVQYALDYFKQRDPSIIVFDEVIGSGFALAFVPLSFKAYLATFVVFRFFDGSKLLGIHIFEKISGVWGVIADDIVAGCYAGLLISYALQHGYL